MNVANRPAERRDRLSFLFLMGYRGTGKTTVGQILAPRLKLPLVDTDQEIQDTHRRTIREIFDVEGEDGFRAKETEAIRRVTSGEPSLVSLGGGSVLRLENRERIRKVGLVIWLQATVDEIYARISNDLQTSSQRPALSNLSGYDEIANLVESREPIYREMADLIVSTSGRSAESIADEIESWWALRTVSSN